MKGPFTGRHMVIVLVTGFGIVFAVNGLMATIAVSGFSGVTVTNSYVASQNFNEWLDEADTQKALGWTTQLSRDDAGHLQVATDGLPEEASAVAVLRRPIGEQEIVHVDFAAQSDAIFTSPRIFTSLAPIPEGRWLVRLTLSSGEDRLELEEHFE